MPSDYDSGGDGRRPPSRPPEGDGRRERPDESEIEPGLRPPKRPAGQRYGDPHGESSEPRTNYPEDTPYSSGQGPSGRPPPSVSGRFEDPWFEDPVPVDESRRPPRREHAPEEEYYAAPQDDYDDYRPPPPPEERPRPRSRTLPVLIALLALAGFAGLLWYAYTWGVGGLESENLPVVAAEESPAKVAPEEPGGMEIPNQDKQVLNQQEEGQSDVERLLPPPEEPNPPVVSDDPAPEPPTENSQESGVTQQQGQEAAPPPAPEPVEEAPPQTASPETASPEAAPAAEEQPAAPAPAPEPPPQLTEAPPGSFVMQLASVRSEEVARAEWARMQGEHELLLGDMPLFIQQVELEGRGIYHRIQTGPFPSRSTAQDLCAQLKAAGQDCLVTQR